VTKAWLLALLGRERLGALQQLLEAREGRRLTRHLRPMGPEEIPGPRGHLEPSTQHRVHKNLPPPSSARCRAPYRCVERLPTAERALRQSDHGDSCSIEARYGSKLSYREDGSRGLEYAMSRKHYGVRLTERWHSPK
jgi:hypothetical protein